MFNLIIVHKYDQLTGWPDQVFELPTDFDTSSQAELRALRWLTYRPDDIITLVELKTADCKHCGLPIEEIPGWIVHQWRHVGNGAYLCWSDKHTKATPKEE